MDTLVVGGYLLFYIEAPDGAAGSTGSEPFKLAAFYATELIIGAVSSL